MKLRTFIFFISFSIVVVLSAGFSFQLHRVLGLNFHKLHEVYVQNLETVARAIVTSKSNYLKDAGKLLKYNYDLTGLYLTAKESGDVHLIQKEIEDIQKDIHVDVADILPAHGPMQVTIRGKDRGDDALFKRVRLKRKQVETILSEREGLTVLLLPEGPVLLALSPMTLYGETVGYLALGFFLNTAVASEIGRVAHADIHFSDTASSASQNLDVFTPDGALISMEIRTQVDAVDQTGVLLTKELLWFGCLCFLLLIGLIYLLLEFGFLRKFRGLLRQINEAARSLREGKLPALHLKRQPILETRLLADAFNDFSKSLTSYDERIKEQSRLAAEGQKQKALAEMAQQVAHDIRSPLSALDMFVLVLEGITEESRLKVRQAVGRIHDIANHLLTQSRAQTSVAEGVNDAPTLEAQLLFPLVESLISEKRIQYRASAGLHLDLLMAPEVRNVFAILQPTEFKTVLSNLINNAVESLSGPGEVLVSVLQSDQTVSLRIADNGSGISSTVLPLLGRRGVTLGKTDGTGLGLYHARRQVESWGGTLEVTSEEGVGTQVSLEIPKAKAPSWFLSELEIPASSTIVVLDDDLSVHQLWAERLHPLTQRSQIEVCYFSSGDDLIAWTKTQARTHVLYLCDYDLRAQSRNGLEVAEQLEVQQSTVLVTHRYEDPRLHQKCTQLGVRLLPKPMVPFLPMSVT